MNITLYKSKSSMNTVDKGGANLTPLLTVSGNFKNAQRRIFKKGNIFLDFFNFIHSNSLA